MSASLLLGRIARQFGSSDDSGWNLGPRLGRSTNGGWRAGPGPGPGPGLRGGAAGRGAGGGFRARAGIIGDSGKLSLYDSSHLTAVVPAGKLEPELLNFIHTQYQARDCSWHVR